MLFGDRVFGSWLVLALGLATWSACGRSAQSEKNGGGVSGQAGNVGSAGTSGSAGNVGGAGTSGSAGTSGGADAGQTDGMGGTENAAGMASGGEGPAFACGGVVCSSLPHVRLEGPFECVDGRCVVAPEACQLGFAHCSNEPLDGCEQQIDRTWSCGACNQACPPELPACVLAGASFMCAGACIAKKPDLCGDRCVDLQSDGNHCGACNALCQLPNIRSACDQGQCVAVGECYVGTAACSSEPGCEPLDTAANCGACGRNDCGAVAHTSLDCSDPDGCLPPLCEAGYANCERGERDCEAAYGTSCWPEYAGTRFFDSTQRNISAVAYGTDGSLFIAGTFLGSYDFDPSPAVDVRDGGLGSLYVTKLNADSTYGWTSAIGGQSPALNDLDPLISVTAAAAGPGGSILLTGSFDSTADFDPGPGTTTLGTAGRKQAYVLSLSDNGSLSWARTWGSFGFGTALATAPGAIYAAGHFEGETDLDPGPGIAPGGPSGAYLVKLTTDGAYIWGRLDAGCASLRAASDGSIWCLGSGASLAVFESDGTKRATALEFRSINGARLEAGVGHMYVAGEFQGKLEIEDGDAKQTRVTRGRAGVLVKVDLKGKLVSARVLPEPIADLAPAPDGLLALGESGSVFWDYADGVSKLRFAAADPGIGLLLAANQAELAVIGEASQATDVDPGQQVATPSETRLFVSRFRF